MSWNYVELVVCVGGRLLTHRQYLPDTNPGWVAPAALKLAASDMLAKLDGEAPGATREVP